MKLLQVFTFLLVIMLAQSCIVRDKNSKQLISVGGERHLKHPLTNAKNY